MLLWLQANVDSEKRKGQFYFSGFQQDKMMKNVSESLAGRLGIVNLLGFPYGKQTMFAIRFFASSVLLSALILDAASSHWKRNHIRNKAIIRTHHRQVLSVVTGSDYMGLVRETGLEFV